MKNIQGDAMNQENLTEEEYMNLFNSSMLLFFKDAMRIALGDTRHAYRLLKIFNDQRNAGRRRKEWRQKGLHVPAFMIASVTQRCNLNCKGCYSKAQGRKDGKEMDSEMLDGLLIEAEELGISVILMAGGEPFMRDDLIPLIEKHPSILFPVFTNGLLLSDRKLDRISRSHNVLPTVSIEGPRSITDDRRGEGVYNRMTELFQKMEKRGSMFGVSFTVTSENLDLLTRKDFITGLHKTGCRLFFFVEYIPVEEGTEELEIDDGERQMLAERLKVLEREIPALFISFPGDEEKFGGCLSSGRGFVHIGPGGDVEACPFAPYSDRNLREYSLKEALRSDLLRVIRENRERLDETSGGCALWEHREWIRSRL